MTSLEKLRQERAKSLNFKNILPLREALLKLPDIKDIKIELGNTVKIDSSTITDQQKEDIKNFALSLKPWRKGPFELFGTFIDSEWQSWMKYNLLEPYFDLKDKTVADIGCNNGYYMFRMLNQYPKKIVGFDPSPLFKTQFDFIDRYIQSGITYELLGVEHLDIYDTKFDTLFCLGVLYHRSDPISTLKALKKALNKNGELFLDTFMIDGDEEMALTPKQRYSKIPNIYFIPTIPALKNWLFRAGFNDVKVLEIKKTDLQEQRKTNWIESQSLENFLDPDNPDMTVEGYPAPKRVYVKATYY